MPSKKKRPATATPEHAGAAVPVELPVDAITKLELFLERRWKTVVSLLVLVVLAVVVHFYLKTKRENDLTESNNVFMAATTRPDLEEVLKKYPGTAAAGSALYSIADRQLSAQQVDEARVSLEQFINDYPDHGLYYNALVGLGGIAERQGKLDEASGYFQQVIDAGDKSPLAPLAAIHHAEVLVAKGELEKAKELYESFAVNYIGSPFVGKATERLAAVEARIARKAAPVAPVEPAPEPVKKPEPNVPVTPEPTPGTPEPTPGTPEPTPGTPEPTPGTPEPTPGTPEPAPGTPEPTPGTPDPAPGTPDPAPGTPAPTPETPAPTPETPAPTPETPAPTPGTPAPTPGTPAPTPETPAE